MAHVGPLIQIHPAWNMANEKQILKNLLKKKPTQGTDTLIIEEELMKNMLLKIEFLYVVPYNPYLTKKYNAHNNVEICSGNKYCKYLYKYV